MLDIRSKQGDIRFSTPINEGSKRKFMLQQEDYILLKFSVAKPIPFKLGDWVKIDGDPTSVFELSKIIRPKQNYNTGGYDYELRLDAYYYKWANKIVKYMPEHGANEATFDLTTDLATHLSVVIRNLKALGYKFDEKDFTFSIDATVKHEHKHIRYEKTNIIDLLNRLAETWDCEWWVVGNVIHFGKCQFGDPIPFEVGKNVETMGSSNDNKRVATRIYAFGSSRNITKDYRHTSEQAVVNGIVQKRLMLPADMPYIDAYPGMSQEEAIEDFVFFEDIYPRRIGSISSVSTKEYTDTVKEDGKPDKTVNWNAYRFTDTGINFSEKYVLPGGDGLKIVFQSGSLNGMEFEVWFNPDKKPEKNDEVWNPEAQVYEIKRNEDYGRPLPDEKLFPKVGDKYILSGFDTSLVSDVYVPQAEQELKAEAEKYVQKSIIDPSTYENRMMSDTMFDEEGNVSLYEFGQRVKLINPAYFENGRLSRIIGYEYDLAVPYDSPTYTVGEVAPKGRIGEIESKVDNLTYKGQTYFGAGGGVYLITSRDSTMPSDHSAFSSRRSVMEFLSRRNRDTAHAHLTFREGLTSEEVVNALKGMKFGEYAPGLTGFGGHIDDKGRAELESLFLRSFLEVPELRYNRVRVITGEEWNSKGGGIIESVDEENKSFQLKLEAGEHPSVSEGDICKLVYNTGAGFGTCYFRVLSVTHDGVVRYALREGYDMHPKTMSHFVAYGNFFDETRQASAYSTTSYTRYLKGVNDWEIGKHNIAMQFGNLSNLQMYGLELEGYSAYLNNVYFTGSIMSLTQQQIDEIAKKVESPYSVTLSSYERVIKEGGEGLRQELKVVTGDKQVMTQGKEVVTSQYSLSTHITVLRGDRELLYSDTVGEGVYTVTLRANGLSATINAGNVIVTNVGDGGGHVEIEVNCEGKTIIPKRFSVTVAKDGEDGKDGVGISLIKERYAAGTEWSVPSTGWCDSYAEVQLTAEKNCVWNYEMIIYTNGAVKQRDPHIIYRRSTDGTAGASVTDIQEWYAVSDNNVTAPPSSAWSKTPPQMSKETPYLWNYSVTYFDDGRSFESPKVVIGRWGEDGKDGRDGENGKSPKIVNGTWWVWDGSKWVDTHDPAQGESGENGKSPKIQNGTWWVWDGEKWVDTGVKAKGDKGTDGKDGKDGKDAHSPKIVGGTWWVWDDAQGRYVDTHDPAQGESGENGKSPKIQNGTWWVWDGEKWVDTGVKAKGDKGTDGKDGRGVDLVVKEWAKTSDPDNPPAQGSSLWSSIPPKPEAGKYIWERTKTVMTDNNVQYTTPVRVELTGVSKALEEAFETSTEIKGGLVATTMLLVRNALGKIRAYFSGAGNKTNDIAFAAGVENFGLPNETQATYIKQNGDAKFGEMYMDANGQVYAMRDGKRYFLLGGAIPTLEQLIAGEGDDVIANGRRNYFWLTKTASPKVYTLSDNVTVKNAGASIIISGMVELLYDINTDDGSPGEGYPNWNAKGQGVWANLYLYKGNTKHKLIKSYSLPTDYNVMETLFYPTIVDQPGTYSLRVEVSFKEPNRNQGYMGARYSGTVRGYFVGAGDFSHFGDDGMAISRGKGNFLLFNKDGLQVGAKTKMPGILAAGRVSYLGIIQNSWGALVNRRNDTIPNASKSSTGVYVVYHSIPHGNYIPTVTCMDEDGVSAYVRSSEILPYQFTVRVFGTSSQNPYDSGFTYQLVGAP